MRMHIVEINENIKIQLNCPETHTSEKFVKNKILFCSGYTFIPEPNIDLITNTGIIPAKMSQSLEHRRGSTVC